MQTKEQKQLDSRKTSLLVLLFCVYAFVVCYGCARYFTADKDFGVLANTQNEQEWRVSE